MTCCLACRPPDPPSTDASSGSGGDTQDPTEVLAPFEANFLWAPILFDGAISLGHVPTRTETTIPGRETVLDEVAEISGLAASMAGGNRHGVGIGFFDVDGDGWADILVANGIDHDQGITYPSALWHNNGDGTFSDATVASGWGAVLEDLDTYSVSAADYDADGDLDVLVTAHPTDKLLNNDGAGHFTDGSAGAGIGGPPSSFELTGWSKIGAWGDVDNDGWMDIAVVSSTFDDHPPHGYLMHNEGDGTFADWTDAVGFAVSTAGNPCALMWSDYDNDGDADVHVWNDRMGPAYNRTLLRNDGGVFSDQTEAAWLWGASATNPMGIDAADTDHDGFLDYYIGNIGNAVFLSGSEQGTFVNRSLAAGVEGNFTWATGFEDLNLDGWWDLFTAQERYRPYISYTNQQTTPSTFGMRNWDHGPIDIGSHNVPGAFADYDGDGDVDIVTGGTGGHRLNLFRNDTDRVDNRWLQVVVPSVPGTGAWGGIGGRVVVQTPDRTWFDDLVGGSGRGSQSAMSARFGLGPWDGATFVAVLWPDGRQSVVTGVPADQVLRMP